ncbi:MAG: hypothetical protein KKB20_15005 [Proteobacteria bacterium]|nr:hypothetical protein [Pseudomonadota bacterium]
MTIKRIAVDIPPEGLWLGLVDQAISHFARVVGFSEALRRMLAGAALEACEELIRASAEVDCQSPFRLGLEFKGEAVIIEIEYDHRVPLNPHQVDAYEVPDPGTNLDEVDVGALWLHMIKHFMDRVFFRVEGSRRVLRMIKYSREEGREHRAWVMALRPRLKKGLILHLSDPKTLHPSCVLQNPGGAVLKLGPSGTFVIRRLDGETTLHDIYMAHVDELGLVSPSEMMELYESLEAANMLADPDREAQGSRWKRLIGRIINLDISIPHADDIVTRVHARTRFLFSPAWLALLLAVGLSGAIPAWLHYAQLTDMVVNLEATVLERPIILVLLYLLLLIHVVLHELGHGVVCKHYGGQIPRLGLMFYLGSFIFYCDTTAAWNFPLKRQRLLVSLGGPIVSFAILGIGLWIAALLAGTDTLWDSVFTAFSLVNFFALAMGFNPLIKMDGYYMLVDLTDIPNLRAKSFRFLERRLLGWLGFGEDKALAATPRERKRFWWYGILGSLVTVFFLGLPVVHLVRLLSLESISRGRLILAVLVCVLVLGRVGSVAFWKLRKIRHREYKLP